MRKSSLRHALAAVLPLAHCLRGLAGADAAAAAPCVVPAFAAPRHRPRRRAGQPRAAAPSIGALPLAPTASSVDGVTSVRAGGARAPKDDGEAHRHDADRRRLVEQAESTPPGTLTRDDARDMLTVMRQLSSMGRRRDDRRPQTHQRRQDATTVERLLAVLLKEQQYATRAARQDPLGTHSAVNARTYNLAIKAWANANVRGSAGKADRVLQRLRVAHVNAGTTAAALRPDLYSFAYCYAAWYREAVHAARAVGPNAKAAAAAMRRADAVLVSMKQALMSGHGRAPPVHMVEDVNSLLVMWGNAHRQLPELSETFLRFIDAGSRTTDDAWFNTRSYNLVINAWAKSGRHEAIPRAEALIEDMEKSSTSTPDLLSYSGVISCLAKSKRAADAAKADAVLRRITEMEGVEPDTVIFNQVMNIQSKGGRGSTAKCEALLQRMEDLAERGQRQAAPDARTFNLLLSAYANEDGPAQAEKVLRRLEGHASIQPNAISYTTCMDAYAKRGDAHNNLRILSLMEKAFQNGNSYAKPTRRAYVSALNSLAKSGRGDAGERGEALVQRMEKMAAAGDTEVMPDTTVYNVLISCHKRPAQAEQVLYRMGRRDVVSYSHVINIHSKMGGVKSATRAQALLDEMQREDVAPNAHAFNSAITAWSRSGSKGAAQKAEALLKNMEQLHEAGNTNLQPSARVYTSVISAWANSNEAGSALRAEILLKLMWALYKRSRDASVKPNVQTFTSVINAWARSREREAGERAEHLLDQMIKLYEKDPKANSDVMPNVLTFTSVMHAHSRVGSRGAASKATGILKKMESLGVEPNLQTYNVLISLYGNCGEVNAGKKAESILQKLEDACRNGDEAMRPTVISYTSAINAWAKSTDHGKAERARAVLERMKAMHQDGIVADQPNIFSYTSVINACAGTDNARERQKAFHIAYSTFKEISDSESLSPNHVTYSTFLRAISKLMPNDIEKRDSLASAAFRLCVRDGQCDSKCLYHMRNAATPELVSDLLGCRDSAEAASVTFEELPFSWTCNVKQK